MVKELIHGQMVINMSVEWKDDQRNTAKLGTYTHADGSKEEGIWKDDKFL